MYSTIICDKGEIKKKSNQQRSCKRYSIFFCFLKLPSKEGKSSIGYIPFKLTNLNSLKVLELTKLLREIYG